MRNKQRQKGQDNTKRQEINRATDGDRLQGLIQYQRPNAL